MGVMGSWSFDIWPILRKHENKSDGRITPNTRHYPPLFFIHLSLIKPQMKQFSLIFLDFKTAIFLVNQLVTRLSDRLRHVNLLLTSHFHRIPATPCQNLTKPHHTHHQPTTLPWGDQCWVNHICFVFNVYYLYFNVYFFKKGDG